MGTIIGDDRLRRALAATAPAPKAKHSAEERAAQPAQALKAEQWMQAPWRHSIAQATKTGWILDCDTTVKLLHGHQDGAVVSDNPHKPGRPSHIIHIIHTDRIGHLRPVLDAQLQAGHRHSPSQGRTGLRALLQRLPADERPSWSGATAPKAAKARGSRPAGPSCSARWANSPVTLKSGQCGRGC